MARIVRVLAGDVRLGAYTELTDVPVRSIREEQSQRFVLEGMYVLERAIAAGITPQSVLVSERMADRTAALLADVDTDVLVASHDVLEETTGYHVHRGVLAEAIRPSLRQVDEVVDGAKLILMLEALRDHANVGAAFRNGAALGADAVLVSRDCADPLYRRAVKTSMGAVLQVPWTRVEDWTGSLVELKERGFEIVALTPRPEAEDLGAMSHDRRPRALLVGTEGDGLRDDTLRLADRWARIPMRPGPDSLNAAAATAVALYALGPGVRPQS